MPIQEADQLQQADDDDDDDVVDDNEDDATLIARTHINRSHESFTEWVRRFCSFKSAGKRNG